MCGIPAELRELELTHLWLTKTSIRFLRELEANLGPTVVFENERVRVLHVKHAGEVPRAQASRHDRLFISTMGTSRVPRCGKTEKIRRKAGEVGWRNRSQHYIENRNDTNHEVKEGGAADPPRCSFVAAAGDNSTG